MHIPDSLARRLDQGRAERALLVERSAIDETARTATIAFASETPYERFWGVEILDCTPASIRMDRLNSGANLLCDHDPKDVIGVVESVQIGPDRIVRAVVRFGKSARAEEVWQDVRDGIRRNVSVGYLIHTAQLIETDEGRETYRVTDWEPYEVSLVSIPADASVGVGRSSDAAPKAARPTLSLKKPNLPKEKIMENQTVSENRNHAQEIAAIAATIPNGAELAMKSLAAGHTVEQFQQEAIKAMSNKPLATADHGSAGCGLSASRGQAAGTLGEQVVRAFGENRDIFAKTKSVSLQLRAATDTITTSSGRTIVNGGVGFVQGGVLGLQNALPVRVAPASALEYSRYTGQQGAAAVQAAEGDTKAAVRPDHTLITQTAMTIAGYAKMSRQAINDQSELRRAVEVTLNRSVATALDTALVNGAAGFTGFEGLATAYTSLVYTSLVDAISEGVSTMQTAGFSPDVVALNPADWLAITTAKGTANDHYLSGSYLAQIEPVLRGLRVVLSPSVDAGKGLVMDSTHSELLIVEDFTVEIGYAGDDFIKNLAVLLGEMRVIPVFRTVGSARLITPKA